MLPTALAGKGIRSVVSVRLSVRMFQLYLLLNGKGKEPSLFGFGSVRVLTISSVQL